MFCISSVIHIVFYHGCFFLGSPFPAICEEHLQAVAQPPSSDIWAEGTDEGEGHHWGQRGGQAARDVHRDDHYDREEECGEPGRVCMYHVTAVSQDRVLLST